MTVTGDSVSAKKGYWLTSSDSHIVEPPDLFTTRIDRRFIDQAPRVIDQDGMDFWVVGDYAGVPAINPSRAGDRFDDPGGRRKRVRFDSDVRPGGYLPDEWITDNESDGVYGGVLFPSMSLIFYGIPDTALLTAVCRTYTDWALEFASAFPNRLKAVAMINVDDIDDAVKELERARRRGASGALIPVAPGERSYDRSDYDRLWAAAQDLSIPLNMHVATNRTPGEWRTYSPATSLARLDYWVRVAIADMIFSGVFERFPRLRVGSVEHEAGWAAFFVRRMDHQYTQSIDFAAAYPRFRSQAIPSDFFHRNVFVSFTEDDIAVGNRDVIGIENLTWGNDYPHGESTFPHSREIVADKFKGVPSEELIRMTQTNAAVLYNIVVPAID
jgi:predicted TIM-barrel fold metal-dependent hydrolase